MKKSVKVINLNSNKLEIGFGDLNEDFRQPGSTYRKSPSYIYGKDVLIQNIILKLFTNKNSNSFDPDVGGSLGKIIQKGYQANNIQEMRTSMELAIKRVENQIKEDQSNEDLDPEETLENIQIEKIGFNQYTKRFLIDLKILTIDGEAVTFKQEV